MLSTKRRQNPADWQAYEKAVIDIHRARPDVTNVWEWGQHNSPPEMELEKAGYINSYNKVRLNRLAAGGKLRDCGFDFLSKEISVDSVDSVVYCGGQAKYYTGKVTANDIGTFLMYQRMLYKKNPKSIGYLYTSSNLQEDLRDNVKDPDFGIKHILHKWKPDNMIVEEAVVAVEECDYTLYDYQQELLDEMRGGVGLLGLYIPCGLGKTVIAGHHMRRLGAGLIVAIAPLRASVSNLQDRLMCFFKGYKSLLVDSDVGGTTDAAVVTEFLEMDGNKIIFSTFDSAVNVLSEWDFSDAFILGDEIHNALGNVVLCEFINGFGSGLLMSATMPEEITVDGEVKSLSEIIDIDGTYSRTFGFAIEKGLIVDYNLWLPHQVKKEDGTNGVSIEIPVGFEIYDRDLCAKVLYLASGMLKTGSRRCIVYLCSKAECVAFSELAKTVFLKYHGLDLWSGIIDSDVSAAGRKAVLKSFESGDNSVYKIVCSVRILDEAIDVPRCDSVFITTVGVHSSDIRMMQRAMRSGRLDASNPNKRNNIFLWADGWESCVGALELLRDADPDFHKKVRIIDSGYDGQNVKERVAIIEGEAGEFKKWVDMRCLSLMDKHLLRIGECKVFYEKYGLPKWHGKKENETILYNWMSHRRKDKKTGTLIADLENQIMESLPWFSWNPVDDRHNKTINEIKAFYEKYKGEPKQHRKRDNESSLASWMRSRRNEKKQGKLSVDLEYQIIESLPWFSWNPFDDQHNKTINDINIFYEKHKVEPKRGGKIDNESILAAWMGSRRKDKKKGKLSAELESQIIDSLNWFRWNPYDDQHTRTINDIKIFYEKHKIEPKKGKKKENEKNLAIWIVDRRRDKKKGKLSAELESQIIDSLNWFRW